MLNLGLTLTFDLFKPDVRTSTPVVAVSSGVAQRLVRHRPKSSKILQATEVDEPIWHRDDRRSSTGR